MYKTCTKCGVSKPATTEFFYAVEKNRDGLSGDCKVCKNKQTRKYDIERRKNGQHLIHRLTCDWCGKKFKSDSKEQRFCSRECQYDWQRNSEEYTKARKNIINQYGNLEQRQKRFKNKFEKHYPDFKYHSGYDNSEGNFKAECKKCGHVQEMSVISCRPWNTAKELRCEECFKRKSLMRRLANALVESVNKDIKQKEREVQKKVNQEVEALQRIKNNHNYYLECQECGRMFFSSFERKFCSIECGRKNSNRNGWLIRERRIKENGKVDSDISLQRLAKRDHNQCYLCGKQVDWTVDSNDNYYPSIDHVKPLCKGGTHTWDNVKLAHRICNSEKGART